MNYPFRDRLTIPKECIKLLLDHGADPDRKSKMQELPEECLPTRLSNKDKAYLEDIFARAREAR